MPKQSSPQNFRVSDLSGQKPEVVAKALESLSDREAEALLYCWEEWARPEQLPPPGDWSIWLILAGRGFGKTRSGAEWVRAESKVAPHIALVAPTAADGRDIMVEGEAGIMSVFPDDERPLYEPSKRRVTFKNGSQATVYSADEPDRLRGPSHHAFWADEIASWKYPEAWDMLMLTLRLGKARGVATTTPRPIKLLRELIKRNGNDVAVTKGTTYDNLHNLSPAFRAQIIAQYEGTRLGRQELNAEILDDVPGALWTRNLIEQQRVTKAPDMRRIVVAVDPAASNTEQSDHTGIVVCGLGTDGNGYVLEDASMRGTPAQWAAKACDMLDDWKADRIIAEKNQGGDMVTHTLQSHRGNAPVKLVHASRGKRARAEPVSALYEQGKIHHVGVFEMLEDEQCTWDGAGDSPDRMDALVWGMTELMVKQPVKAVFATYGN
jgi:phage terminase large subunit-like protein